jgi:hypothetical protein
MLEEVTAEIARLRSELGCMHEREDVLKKYWASSPKGPGAVCPDLGHEGRAPLGESIRATAGIAQRVLPLAARGFEPACATGRCAGSANRHCHARSRRAYGAPRIVHELHAQQLCISPALRAADALAWSAGLQTALALSLQKGPPARAYSCAEPTAPAGQTNRSRSARVPEITLVSTGEWTLELAAILDGRSRRVVGWARGPILHASLGLTALRYVIPERRP